MFKEIEFTKGNMKGVLKRTQTENHQYKWIQCITLLDDNGRWLTSKHWRANHFIKATKELINNGWKIKG